MIARDEIDSMAADLEVTPANVERDYVFGWLLFGLFTKSDLKDQLFLKGGNALRKGYLPQTRFSNDLDLGIPGDVDPDLLRAEINGVCSLIQDLAGVTFATDSTRVEEKFHAAEAPLPDLRVFEVRVYFHDFYGKPGHVRLKVVMDVTRFDRVLLPLQSVELIHPYSDAAAVACSIRCMKLEEIIATKLKCLLQREHAPDLFDYVHALRLMGHDLNRSETVRTFLKKTIFERNPQTVKRILLATPWDFCRDTWKASVICAKAAVIEVNEAIRSFSSDLEALFAEFPDNGFAEFAYFGPSLRVPIMKAARSETLLKMRYKGEDRIVEPYALKYLQRRDGAQREYFFGFNRTGGTSGPGMRQFVADRLESIENTDERFEPQFPIELSKAGERPENPYLFDPNKPAKAPRRGVSRIRFPGGSLRRQQVMHVYQCRSCGREFPKQNRSATLRPHKDSHGYACRGRSGMYIRMDYT